mgnify:CR=1 FL=1
MLRQQHDVVIIGAGLAGLSAAVFLALNGVRAVLIERHPSTSVLPKARGQNPVTMEMLRVAGITDAIRAARPPGKPAITSLVSESLTGKVIYDHIAHRPDFSRFSPEIPGMASQARAEEALLDRARELNVDIRFNSECESVAEREDSVDLRIRDLHHGSTYAITSQYLIACDGIRGNTKEQIGIADHGVGHLKSVTAVRFNADLSRWAGDNSMVIHYVQNTDLPDDSGILVSTDYKNQWVANFSSDAARTPEETRHLIYILLGLTEDQLDIEITGETTYNYSHRIADRLSTQRVFLTGDAAHVMPPTGGQGGNTALQDGFYLGWKLGYVVRGIAGPGLLASYDIERRPYAEVVCTWQAANLAERRDMKSLAEITGDPIDHATMMFGYVCVDGAFVKHPDQSTPSLEYPFEDPSAPTAMPGARVPYVYLNSNGKKFNTRHYLSQQFQIYTDSAALVESLQAVGAELGVPQQTTLVESVEPLKIQPGNAMLIRPDGVVAWRGNSAENLKSAYQTILARA